MPSATERQLSWRTFLTVEPVLFLYAFGLFLNVPVSQQYVYYRLSKAKGFPYDFQENTGCNQEVLNSSMKELEMEVQTEASYVQLGTSMCSALPSIIITLFMGGWSDRVGRRPALIIPVVGSAIESVIILVVVYLKLPIYFLFIGGFAHGLCGYYTAIVLACMSYVADTTDERNIALRLGIIDLLVFLGGTAVQLVSGPLIESLGFIAPYWFICGCLISGIVYAAVFVPESRVRCASERKQLFSLDNFTSSFLVYKATVGSIRRNLILLTVSSGLLGMTIMGIIGVVNLFTLHSPLCFSPNYVGYFSGFRLFVYGVGAVTTIKLLGVCLSDANISRIAIVSYLGFLVYLGFSTTPLMVFTSPLVGVCGGAAAPVLRSMMSKIVSSDHQGSLFSAVSALGMFFTFSGTALFNSLYPKSLKFDFPGFVFLLAAGLLLLPLIFTYFLKDQAMFKKKRSMINPTSGYEKIADGDSDHGPEDKTPVPTSDDSTISVHSPLISSPSDATKHV